MHLEHVNLTVTDLDRATDFYGQLLGLEVRWTGTTSAGRRAAHIGTDSRYLALFEAERPERANAPDYERVGFNHLGFVVDDLDEAKSRLASLGIAPKHEDDYEPGRRLYFFDPDGIEVELVTYNHAVL